MAFNPDTFIAEGEAPAPKAPAQGFDPDAFLSQPTSPEAEADAIKAHEDSVQAQYGTPGQQAIAGVESAGRSTTFGLSNLAETKLLGVKPEDIRGREEANPGTAFAGTVAGLLTPMGEGAALAKVGKVAAEKLVPKVVGEGILQGIARSAVKIGAENALYQAGDENAKMLVNDPNQSVGSAITNIGLAGVLGAATGGVLGGVSPLWKATVGDRAGALASDFKARYSEHLNNPDPVGALTEELTNYHQSIKSAADEVYGATGLKAQDISKAMPEMSPKITEATQEITTKAEQTLQDMAKKGVPERYLNKFMGEFNKFQDVVSKQTYSPEALFNATQDFKQALQGYSKGNFGPFAVPSYHEAYDFLASTKNLSHEIRTSLENPDVWGKAAERQLSINKAFKEYLPTLKDFEKRFTTEVNGERTVDPAKINTYLNQIGKPSAELKQEMLKNFLDASDQYRNVINDTHTNLGIENPMEPVSTHHARKSLDELTPGAKLADLVVKKGMGVVGKSVGAGIGGLAGAVIGHPYIGAAAGEHILGPFIESTLPALVKPLLEKVPSGTGLKAATEYGAQVVRGQKLATDAVKSVFDKSIKALPDTKRPSPETRAKLKSALEDLQKDPNKLMAGDNHLDHYMTDHAVALSTALTRVLSALQAARPPEAPKTPLDIPRPPSKAVQAQYDRILDIAQQPLVTIGAIKNGRLTSKDVMALNTMYPELYQGLKQKLMTEMVSHKAAGNDIPYTHRMGLSLFLGQPLDSTMTPGAIQAAQPKPEQQSGGQVAETGGKRPSNQAGSTMLKNSKLARTPTQQSEAMHSTGKA